MPYTHRVGSPRVQVTGFVKKECSAFRTLPVLRSIWSDLPRSGRCRCCGAMGLVFRHLVPAPAGDGFSLHLLILQMHETAGDNKGKLLFFDGCAVAHRDHSALLCLNCPASVLRVLHSGARQIRQRKPAAKCVDCGQPALQCASLRSELFGLFPLFLFLLTLCGCLLPALCSCSCCHFFTPSRRLERCKKIPR